MARPLLNNRLWELIKPMLPKRSRCPKAGRFPIDGRRTPTGIIFVPKAGIFWEYLPQGNELRFGYDLLAASAQLPGHGNGLGVYHWVVERTLSWLHQFHSFWVHHERHADAREVFL